VRRTTIALLLLVPVAILLSVVQANSFSLSKMLGGGDEQKLDTFKLIHVANLKAMMADQKNTVNVFDANGAATRSKFGVIPGAKLLDSDQNYDLSVLPADKDSKLVFYCANTH
jgi:rhodanese-related sulfurtransferase